MLQGSYHSNIPTLPEHAAVLNNFLEIGAMKDLFFFPFYCKGATIVLDSFNKNEVQC